MGRRKHMEMIEEGNRKLFNCIEDSLTPRDAEESFLPLPRGMEERVASEEADGANTFNIEERGRRGGGALQRCLEFSSFRRKLRGLHGVGHRSVAWCLLLHSEVGDFTNSASAFSLVGMYRSFPEVAKVSFKPAFIDEDTSRLIVRFQMARLRECSPRKVSKGSQIKDSSRARTRLLHLPIGQKKRK